MQSRSLSIDWFLLSLFPSLLYLVFRKWSIPITISSLSIFVFYSIPFRFLLHFPYFHRFFFFVVLPFIFLLCVQCLCSAAFGKTNATIKTCWELRFREEKAKKWFICDEKQTKQPAAVQGKDCTFRRLFLTNWHLNVGEGGREGRFEERHSGIHFAIHLLSAFVSSQCPGSCAAVPSSSATIARRVSSTIVVCMLIIRPYHIHSTHTHISSLTFQTCCNTFGQTGRACVCVPTQHLCPVHRQAATAAAAHLSYLSHRAFSSQFWSPSRHDVRLHPHNAAPTADRRLSK